MIYKTNELLGYRQLSHRRTKNTMHLRQISSQNGLHRPLQRHRRQSPCLTPPSCSHMVGNHPPRLSLLRFVFSNIAGEEDALVDVEIPKFLKKDRLDDYFNAVETDKRAKL